LAINLRVRNICYLCQMSGCQTPPPTPSSTPPPPRPPPHLECSGIVVVVVVLFRFLIVSISVVVVRAANPVSRSENVRSIRLTMDLSPDGGTVLNHGVRCAVILIGRDQRSDCNLSRDAK